MVGAEQAPYVSKVCAWVLHELQMCPVVFSKEILVLEHRLTFLHGKSYIRKKASAIKVILVLSYTNVQIPAAKTSAYTVICVLILVLL